MAANLLLTILPLFWPKMPPLGLGYLQSYLQSKRISADIFDLNNFFYSLADGNLKKQWLVSCNLPLENKIFSFIRLKYSHEFQQAVDTMLRYDVVGFSCFKSNLAFTLEIARILKLKKKNIKIILGGPEMCRQFFKLGDKINNQYGRLADYFIIGEGEKPLYNYLTGKSAGKTIAKFEQLKSLSKIAFPRYRGLDFNVYPRKTAMALQFSRGCIKSCNFCSERLLYKGFRRRDTGELIKEISYFKSKHGIDNFIFFDSMINADLSGLEGLCDQIVEKFGSIHWEAQLAVRPDMPERILRKMKTSGCYNLFIGMESGSKTVLKKMNKGFSVEEALTFFKKLKKCGLFFGISIITGYPQETKSEFKESLDFVIKHKDLIPKIEQVNPFTYYDGTSADKSSDYKLNQESLNRMEEFIKGIKEHNFRYTNAFLGNLVEKHV